MKLFLLITAMLLQAPAPPRTGTGTITGTVIVAGTSEPIPEADIAISTAAELLETTTDSNGRFSLGNVPAGNHTVIVRADGFFAAPAAANAVPQTKAEVPVTVAPGTSPFTAAPVAMIRGAIITGKVVDPQGKPLPFATVQALRPGPGAAILSIPGVASRITDDQGEYRLFWVPPGEYLIGVDPRFPAPANLTVPPPPGTAPPRIVRTLFPGTTDVAQANKVAVKSGDEIRGIDISARLDAMNLPSQPVPTGAKISGQITNNLGPLTAPGVLMIGSEADPGQPRQVGSVALNAATVPFQIPPLPPGKYDLFVRVNDPRGSVGAGGASNAWGRATVEVRDRDVEGVQMTLHASVDVPGILKVDGKEVSGGGALKVGLSPVGVAGRIPNFRGILDRAQTPGEGGKFTIPGAAEGNYDVVVQGGSANSYIADVRQGDTSILATGVAVGEAVPAVLEVLFATDGGIVEGVVTGSDKSPLGGAAVVLVPEDRLLVRLSRNAITGPDGRYSIRGIRPGEYKVFAGPPGPAPAPASLTSEMFSKVEAKGVKVTVKAATTARADATLVTD